MGSAIENNSTSIHDYRGQIAHAIDELKLNLQKTDSAIDTVSESWKDDNFCEFQENFNQDKEQIKPLCDALDNYASNLLYQLEQKLRALEEQKFGL